MLRCKKNISSFHQPKSAGSSESSTTTDFLRCTTLLSGPPDRANGCVLWKTNARRWTLRRAANVARPCRNRATIKRQMRDDQATNARRNPCNPLIIKGTLDIVEYSRVEKSIVEKTSSPKPSSSKMDDDGGAGEPQVPGRSQAVHAGKRSEAGAVAYRPYPTCPGRKKNT